MSGVTMAADRAALEANVRRFYVYRFLVNMQLWLPIWVLYLQEERGLTLAQITALDAPFWLINVLAQVPTGAFADRYGRKRAMLVGCVVLSAAYLMFGLASSYTLLLGSYALWAVGMAFGSGADLALLYDNLAALGRSEEYQRAAGRAFGYTSAAAIVGLIAGAELAKLTRLDVPIVVSAGITLATVGIVLRFQEPPHEERSRPHPLRALRSAIALSWGRAPLRYLLLFSAALMAASFAPVVFVQPFLKQYHTPVALTGLLQAPGRLCGVAAAFVAYRLARRFGDRHLMLVLSLWICGSLAVVAAWQSPLAFVAFPLLAFGFSAANPVLSDCTNRLIPAAQRATVLSLGQLVSGLLLIGFEPAIGAAAQWHGVAAAFLLTAGFLGLALVFTLLPWIKLADDRAVKDGLVTANAP